MNSVAIELNVRLNPTPQCRCDLILCALLFLADSLCCALLILCWLHREYHSAALCLCIAALFANALTFAQWLSLRDVDSLPRNALVGGGRRCK